jgi:hypothetical protein
MGASLGLLFGVVAAWSVKLRRTRAHDRNDRMLVRGGAWLLVVGLAAGFALRDTSSRDLMAPFSALAASALLAAFGCLHGAARVAWLRRVRAGNAPGWSITSDPRIHDDALPAFCTDRRGHYDALLTYLGPVRGLPFRPALPTPVARVARLDEPGRGNARAAVVDFAVALTAVVAAVRVGIEIRQLW